MECPACHTANADAARFCAKCGALLPAPKDESDALLGSVVGGRFRITGVLGEGGMGRVYTAEQQMGTTTRKVAVKTLLSEFARDVKVVERFMRECATVVELEHPNTIKFYDYGKTDAGDLYIAMELLTGASLEQVLEGGALSPERVDRILAQIAGSLQEAHDQGIVHRDLKPANIYLTTRAGEPDYVKVLDFGIAKRDDRSTTKAEAKLTQQGTVLGTPPYMSPEQFRGGELDARSDIYSLGVMAYEMLTGRLPFDADTPWAWATQHMTAQPFPFEIVPPGSLVPAKMKAAVMRALSKDKAQRQQLVKEFFDELTMGASRSSMIFGSGTGSQPGSGPALGGGRLASYSGGPVTGEHYASSPGLGPGLYPSSPGMTVPAGAYPGAPQIPPPPATSARRSSSALIGASIAIFGVLGVVGTVLFLNQAPTSGSERGDTTGVGTTPPTTTLAPPPVDAGKPPRVPSDDDAGTPAAGGSTDAGAPRPPGPGPFAPPRAEQACRAAEVAATRNDLATARRHFSSCEGPFRGVARAAIDQAEMRERGMRVRPPPPPPPCRGRYCPR